MRMRGHPFWYIFIVHIYSCIFILVVFVKIVKSCKEEKFFKSP